MTQYNDAMLDLETLGTDPDCVVLSLGIVFFNLNDEDNYETLDDTSRSFYITLDPQEQINMGRSVTFKTISWWHDQDAMAKSVFKSCFAIQEKGDGNYNMLKRLTYDLGNCKDVCLWGNGSGFDNPIFNSLLQAYEIANPFRFWNDNDFRTLKRLAGKPKLELVRGVYHNALDDAKYQVLAAQEYARIINEGRE